MSSSSNLNVLASVALKGVLEQLAPEFRQSTGFGLAPVYAPAGVVVRRVREGVKADVIVVTPDTIEILIKEGFAVPDTLVTSDREAVLEFRDKHGVIIYKSISAARSIVSRLGSEHMARLDDLRWCPTQFQQYVPGADHRVHVVGDAAYVGEPLPWPGQPDHLDQPAESDLGPA